jgi:hypothetical protein
MFNVKSKDKTFLYNPVELESLTSEDTPGVDTIAHRQESYHRLLLFWVDHLTSLV